MPLPAPNLDDRRFQSLVDDAKRFVQQRCPEWTDHNVSDPGVTLIELFAAMVDQVLYRLNRVPDRNYIKFLDLIGVRLFPPTAARTDATFWLSAPQDDAIEIPRGTEVATIRTETTEAVTFRTVEELRVIPCHLANASSSIAGDEVRRHDDALALGQGFFCFDTKPKPGDSLFVGLSNPVPSCAVVLRFESTIEGVGVDPTNPPRIWEAWDGGAWVECEIDHDETGGFNRSGDVVLHVPRGHATSLVGGVGAGWLRCRVTESLAGQPAYSRSPKIDALAAFTIGGTVESVHAEMVEGEVVGVSEGTPGQRFPLQHRPIVAGDGFRVLEVAGEEGWEEWGEVASFAESGPDDRHFMLDEIAGEVVLGPAVREQDGALRPFGKVPDKGELLRLRAYQTGGGRGGNVVRGAIRVLRSSIAFVARVENRHPAVGGVDAEDLESAKIRGPLQLRTGSRAVTTEDYEQLAREAAPEVARISAVAAGDDGTAPGTVRVLVVPDAPDESGRIRFDRLRPSEETLHAIGEYLDERRIVGTQVAVEPPRYQGITVTAILHPRPRVDAVRLETEALEALYRYFHPVRGGPEGTGWPFGRPVIIGEVYSVLQSVPGVEFVEEVELYPADPHEGKRGKEVDRIDLGPHELVFSYEHRVRAAAASSQAGRSAGTTKRGPAGRTAGEDEPSSPGGTDS
jgi:predicted phage baseplate assembly protein